MADIILVTMPYGSLAYPSVALGVLTAGAKAAGLDIATVQAQFRFAELIGFNRYTIIASLAGQPELFGEWTFSPAAFPEARLEESAYIRRFVADNDLFPSGGILGPAESPMVGLLGRVRAQTRNFVAGLAAEILESNPAIVGCSSSLDQHCASLALLRKIKELNPSVVTLLGGPNCEGGMGPANLTAFPWLDFVVSGEADELFPRLCRAILDRGPGLAPADLPDGVFSAAAPPVRTDLDRGPVSSRIRAMDGQPVPDYDDYFKALARFPDRDRVFPSISVESSRGCWWGKCVFCSFNGERGLFRAKSPERVLREIEALQRRYGLTRFLMAENNLAPAYLKSFLQDLADRPEPELLLEWGLSANLSGEEVKLLARAGVRSVLPGIEALQDDILKALNKPVKAIQNVAFLKNARQNGIRVNWFLLYDFPGDDPAWYRQTAELMPLLFHLAPPRMLLPVRFERHSRYHLRAGDYGLDLSPESAYGFVYPLSQEQLQDLAFYFEDRGRAFDQRLEPEGMAEVRATVARWRQVFSAGLSTGPKHTLTARIEGDGLLITDTRPCAPRAEVELSGPAAQLYLDCRQPETVQTLAGKIKEPGGSAPRPEQLETLARDLVDRKLMISLSGKLLSLALFEPVRELITDAEIRERAKK